MIIKGLSLKGSRMRNRAPVLRLPRGTGCCMGLVGSLAQPGKAPSVQHPSSREAPNSKHQGELGVSSRMPACGTVGKRKDGSARAQTRAGGGARAPLFQRGKGGGKRRGRRTVLQGIPGENRLFPGGACQKKLRVVG